MVMMESKYMLAVMSVATVWALFAVDVLILCGVSKSVCATAIILGYPLFRSDLLRCCCREIRLQFCDAVTNMG